MKKQVSLLLACVLLCGCMFVLASCSNVSQSYADKVNEAAENKEHFTKAQVLEDLGEDAFEVDLVIGGTIMAVKGCKSWEDVEAKLDEGETVKGIVVVIAFDKAVSAEYREITDKDHK